MSLVMLIVVCAGARCVASAMQAARCVLLMAFPCVWFEVGSRCCVRLDPAVRLPLVGMVRTFPLGSLFPRFRREIVLRLCWMMQSVGGHGVRWLSIFVDRRIFV